jgi:hypothetical protein
MLRIRGLYGAAGAMTALWGATLPATDARLDLGAGRLGGVLLLLGAAALVAMPVAGRCADRWGPARLLRWVAPGCALVTAVAALAPSFAVLACAAVGLGLLMGALNVALTVAATAVEVEGGRAVMSTVHATWSLGAVLGTAAVTAALAAGVPLPPLVAAQAIALAACFARLSQNLPSAAHANAAHANTADDPRMVAPPRLRLLVLLGVVGGAAFLVEGAATDWAGVHARRVLGAGPSAAPVVYAAFLAAMTAARFAGDAIRMRLGAVRTLRAAGVTASAGYAVVLAAPALGAAGFAAAVCGWLLTGAGMALVWPVVASATGAATKGTNGASRLSIVAGISYAGALAGPAVIGYAAEATSLAVAMAIPGLFAVAVAVHGPRAVAALYEGGEWSAGTTSGSASGPGSHPAPNGRPPSASRPCGVSQPDRSGPAGTMPVGLMSR